MSRIIKNYLQENDTAGQKTNILKIAVSVILKLFTNIIERLWYFPLPSLAFPQRRL